MMLAGLAPKLHYMKFLVRDHSPAILTGIGVTGTVATAYLTGRASFKAARIIEQVEWKTARETDKELGETELEESTFPDLSKTQKVKLVWKLYIPPVGMCATTIASIILANKISSKRIAALGVAAGISERALTEYKEKVMQKLGERQERNVRDEIAQDRVTNNEPRTREVVITGGGEVLCYDMLTGRYFQSSAEAIKKAENELNFTLIHHMYASLTEFFDKVGLPATTYSDSVGWNGDNPVNVMISTTMSPDGRPCLAIDFEKMPTSEYYKIHG